MINNLAGLRILVTRPSPQGEILCAHIREQGGEALHLPTIAIAPPADLAALDAAIAELAHQDWLIFVSPQAVYASIVSIRQAWPHLPPHVQIAAIGAGTASALQEAGYHASAVPPPHAWHSEGLLALPAFATVANKKITLITGANGSDTLQTALTARGAHLTTAIAYERCLPRNIDIAPFQAQFQQNAIDVVIATSFTSINNLQLLLGNEITPLLHRVPLLAISERIKDLARDMGFQTIWVSRNASHQAILDFLAYKRNEL